MATRNHVLVFLCMSVIVWKHGIARSIDDQQPEEISSVNCGKLLIGLMSYCADTKHSNVEHCCEGLRSWNIGMCWCESNAFNAACNLAMDYYAFQFRTSACHMNEYFHPDIKLPTSGRGIISSTCPIFNSLPPSDRSENCDPASTPERLRKQRLEFIHRFVEEDVEFENDLAAWSERIDSILSPGARLFSIGISFHFPRRNIKQYLLWRSSLLKGPLWKSRIDLSTIFWRTPNSVSYAAHHSAGHFSFSKIEFVVFEGCTPRITEIYSQEEEAVHLYRQFVYFEPADRHFWNSLRSPDALCMDVHRLCPGGLFPFHNISSCSAFYSSKIADKHVTCTRSAAKRSVLGIHGDTVSCRSMFLDLAQVEPSFCRFLGSLGMGMCRSSGCLPHNYNDVFSEENPRFESSGGYSCSNQVCLEEWPQGTD